MERVRNVREPRNAEAVCRMTLVGVGNDKNDGVLMATGQGMKPGGGPIQVRRGWLVVKADTVQRPRRTSSEAPLEPS